MMYRIVVFITLPCLAFATINNIDDVPEEYRELIPKEVKDFVAELSESDKEVIREIAKDYSVYTHEDQVIAALKEKSPELGAKAEKLHAILNKKIDNLEDEAKEFVKEIIAEARKVQASIVAGNKPNLNDLRDKAKNAIDKYKGLSDSAKEDLQNQFPILTSVFKNEKFQKMVDVMLTKN